MTRGTTVQMDQWAETKTNMSIGSCLRAKHRGFLEREGCQGKQMEENEVWEQPA
jgi:hypothetical protein